MEGAGSVRAEEIGRSAYRWRIAGGIVVLIVLLLMGVLLAPPYYENWRLQRYLSALARDPASHQRSIDLLRALVVDKAASMGLPVRIGDVQITPGPGAPKIEVLYVVHVELPLYTVDLHFRPGAH